MSPAPHTARSADLASWRGPRFARRLAEVFFRRWPLFLIPVVLLAGVGLVQATKVPKEWASAGLVKVTGSTVLTQLQSNGGTDFGYQTPAQKTTQDINTLLSSKAFAEEVAGGAGLQTAIDSGTYSLQQLRADVRASASGDDFVAVSARSRDPELSQRLAASVVSTYRQWVLDSVAAASQSAQTFYEEQVQVLQGQVDQASAAVQDYAAANPEPAVGARPAEEELELQRLGGVLTSAQNQLEEAQTKLRDAQLNVVQAQADIGQQIDVIDEPERPTAPQAIRMDQLIVLATYLVLGLAVAVLGLVVMAALDHRAWSSADVEATTGLPVIAALPVTAPPRRAIPGAGAVAGQSS